MDPASDISRSDSEDPRQGEQVPPRDRRLGCVPYPRTGAAERWAANQVEPSPKASLSRRDADHGLNNSIPPRDDAPLRCLPLSTRTWITSLPAWRLRMCHTVDRSPSHYDGFGHDKLFSTLIERCDSKVSASQCAHLSGRLPTRRGTTS